MTMPTRIATWILGALVTCSVATADAAPPAAKPKARLDAPVHDNWRSSPKPAAQPQQRMHPHRAVGKTLPMTAPVSEDGRIERIEDGMIFYSVELTLEEREAIAQRKGVPLSKVPERSAKTARIDYRALTHRVLKGAIGDEFNIELRQDPRGYVYATALAAPKNIQKRR
jgi:hypothetical protein